MNKSIEFDREGGLTAVIPGKYTGRTGTGETLPERHQALAYGHLVAARILAQIGEDYDRRTRIGVELTHTGLDVKLMFRRIGLSSPGTTELERLTVEAVFVPNPETAGV